MHERIGNLRPVPLDVSASMGQGQLVLYGTGIRNATPVMVSVSGMVLTADYAGAAPGSAGEDQVNVALPAGLPSGLTQVTVFGRRDDVECCDYLGRVGRRFAALWQATLSGEAPVAGCARRGRLAIGPQDANLPHKITADIGGTAGIGCG